MAKNILSIVIVFIIVVIAVRLVKILQLKASIKTYAAFWKCLRSTHGDFTYIALGDSAAQGIGATAPLFGYVGLLADQIAAATGKSVRIVNLSISGARIDDVIQKQLPLLKDYAADLVTIEIGANDVTNYNSETFQSDYDRLAQLLPANTILSNMPYFGGRIHANAQATSASSIVASMADKYHLKMADLQTETRLRQSIFNYSSDFFHPNNRGYRNWDAAFWKIIEPTLDSPH